MAWPCELPGGVRGGVRALSSRGNTQHRMRVAAHTAPSKCGISGREAGFPDEDHSFIRGGGRRFGRMAKVNGAVTGTRGGWGAWGTNMNDNLSVPARRAWRADRAS